MCGTQEPECPEDRKGTSHRKTRPKVEMGHTGAEMFVVMMKFL